MTRLHGKQLAFALFVCAFTQRATARSNDETPSQTIDEPAAPVSLPTPHTLGTRAAVRAPERAGSRPAFALSGPSGQADRGTRDASDESARFRSIALEVPRAAYVDSAFGVSPLALGAAGFAESHASFDQRNRPHLNGGLRIWGSPVDRLLLVMDGQRRDDNDKFAPSFTAQLRLFGSQRDGWALGILGRYKAEGFANMEGEIESGILGSISRDGLHLDLNLVAGGDFDGGEADGECLLRGGVDALSFLRVGFEARARQRLAGKAELPGNRSWDAIAGAQAMAFSDHYFAALTAGPSNVGVVDRLGWSAIATAGGAAF